ncbi:MAG TPA: hypothetical protein VJ579_04950 [Candidatus Paceibacterota bacterium]|nr:hypothetical protein [Candidatus Paceibacterota bacterium]
MDPVVDKLMLNAALERLIAGEDSDCSAMRTIIAYGDTLDKEKFFALESSVTTKSGGDAISGHTAEQGNVSIEDKEAETHKEHSYGIKKDRVGHYKIWKSGEGLLKFHHFWKSDLTTQIEAEDRPEVYHLGYDPKTFEPEHFGYEHESTIFIFWLLLWFRIKVASLELLFGKEKAKYRSLRIHISTKF